MGIIHNGFSKPQSEPLYCGVKMGTPNAATYKCTPCALVATDGLREADAKIVLHNGL